MGNTETFGKTERDQDMEGWEKKRKGNGWKKELQYVMYRYHLPTISAIVVPPSKRNLKIVKVFCLSRLTFSSSFCETASFCWEFFMFPLGFLSCKLL